MHTHSQAPRILGIDFTSAPTRSKPITVAEGQMQGSVLHYSGVQALSTFSCFEALLRRQGPWLGAFDFPFGLPRPFVEALGLGTTADVIVQELRRRCVTRMGFRAFVDAWCNTQPVGGRLLHRRTDLAMPGVRSTSPLQTRYVPVGFMYFEGFSRLVDADVTVPGLRVGSPDRTALEGYPGLLAHTLIGSRSYKNRNEPDRLIARKDLVDALEQGRSRLGLRLKLSHAQRDELVADASGDRLDAVLCLVQAAWASVQPGHGLPADLDPLEGWIVSA